MITKTGIQYITPEELRDHFGLETLVQTRAKAKLLKLPSFKMRCPELGDKRARYYYPTKQTLPILEGAGRQV